MTLQPPERLYTLKQAVEIIPFVNLGALRDWLSRHHEIPDRRAPMGRRKHRMLTLTELHVIRAMRVKLIKEAVHDAAPRRRNGPGRSRRPR